MKPVPDRTVHELSSPNANTLRARGGIAPARASVALEVKVSLYSSSFCGACTATRAALTEAARLVPAAQLTETNVASDPQRAEAADIRTTPTVVIAKDDGTEVFRAEGVPTVPQVLLALARALEDTPG